MADCLAELRAVRKSYASAEGGGELVVFERLDLCLERGESVAIVGPSGSGKSTLLNLIGGLDRPTSGSVLFDGQDIGGLSEDALAHLRNERVGFVFQAHHLLPQCTALENVLVPTLAGSGGSSAASEARARELLDRVGLGERLNHRPGQLSGGECQRVAFARAWIAEPDLILADEPTGALDAANSDELANLLVQWNREQGTTLLVVTHAERLAARMGRALRVESGQLVAAALTEGA